jgi:hypothetical protein
LYKIRVTFISPNKFIMKVYSTIYAGQGKGHGEEDRICPGATEETPMLWMGVLKII